MKQYSMKQLSIWEVTRAFYTLGSGQESTLLAGVKVLGMLYLHKEGFQGFTCNLAKRLHDFLRRREVGSC